MTLCSRSDENRGAERHDPQERLQVAGCRAEAAERGGRPDGLRAAASRGSRAGRLPASPAASFGWWPESAIAQHPYGESGRWVRSLSVTAKRPAGVSVPGLPTATLTRRSTRVPRLTVSRRAERSTCRDTSTAPGRVAAARIQAGRPFGRSGATTRSQPPRRRSTDTTLGEPNSVRGAQAPDPPAAGRGAQRRPAQDARGRPVPLRRRGAGVLAGHRERGLGARRRVLGVRRGAAAGQQESASSGARRIRPARGWGGRAAARRRGPRSSAPSGPASSRARRPAAATRWDG